VRRFSKKRRRSLINCVLCLKFLEKSFSESALDIDFCKIVYVISLI
jgi:hypothetical protein